MSVLIEAGRLFAWVAPERPQDLAFYATEDVPWLAPIAHERDAFVYRRAVDVHDLTGRVPGLRLERVEPAR